MRKLILVSAIALGSLLSITANAQIGVSIGVNFGGPRVVHVPVATPPIAYDAYYNDYYYLPDVGAYYSVGERAYYYNNGGRWMSAAYLPGYRNYDWRTARRYEVHANRPYLNHEYYRSRYNDRRDDYRGNDRFDNRGNGRYDNRYNDRYDDRNDNRGRGNDFNRGNNGKGRGNGNNKFADNRPQSGPFRSGRG
ncbi:MAG: hypothetical protein EOP47_06855 [Sphingobacteriaceae bacterium]|nr:MAG: hypothetical protein EOP47_06855 [Sphingobacteriaceae bacterium]